jgi:hypothetical protein
MPSVVNSIDDQSFTIFKASLADEDLGEPGGWCEVGTAHTLLGLFGDEWLFGDRFGLFVLNAERFE